MDVLDIGLKPYDEVYALQKKLVAEVKENPFKEYLIFVEHAPVYTVGRKTKESIVNLPHPIFEIERGGEITFHNPGQLVCYPILALKPDERDLHLHLRRLENTLIKTLNDLEIEASPKEGATGVWVEKNTKKIASIGIAVSQWVTYHGSALNVNNDLAGFYAIHPCGFSPEVMTSLKVLKNKPFDMEAMKFFYKKNFLDIFKRHHSQ